MTAWQRGSALAGSLLLQVTKLFAHIIRTQDKPYLGSLYWSNIITVLVLRIAHRKWIETKQQPSMLLGPAVPGSCVVSFHILWAILSTSTVLSWSKRLERF